MADVGTRPARPPAPAKLRILSTADELFYNEGIHTVGVDRIISGARVTKATFYKHFHSKELLIIAYVHGRDAAVRELLTGRQEQTDDPAAALRALVDAVATEASRKQFNGCPFINAAAQFGDPSHPVRVAVAEHRSWYRSHIADLMSRLGHPRPLEAADDLVLIRDGTLGSGPISDPEAANQALHRSAERIFAEAD